MTKLAQGKRKVLLVSGTGSGKTVMVSESVRQLASKRVLWLAHRRELIDQAAQALRQVGLAPGLILSGARSLPGATVQVGSIQTVTRRELAGFQYVVIDEAHHYLESNTYGKILAQLPLAQVIGATATPFRMDGEGIAPLWDAWVITPTPEELKTKGYLVPITGWVFRALDTAGVHTRGGDYVQSELSKLDVSQVLGDVVQEWIKRADGVRTVLYACGVEHSKRFAAEFRARGVPAEHLDGTTPTLERAQILARLRSGATRVLCNFAVATEGYDLPDLACVILARPTKSEGLYLQMVGRVLRPAQGKAKARIHDHAGCIERFGGPYAERSYDPAEDRTKAKRETKPLRRCGVCDAITDDVPCPECGAVPAARTGPETVLEAEAVPLEELSRAVTFSKVGQTVEGVLTGREWVRGPFGPCQRFKFAGFHVDAPSDLSAKLVGLTDGTSVRMTYTDAQDLGAGKRKKLFKVLTRGGV